MQLNWRSCSQQHALGPRAHLSQERHQLVGFGCFIDFIGTRFNLRYLSPPGAMGLIYDHAGVVMAQELRHNVGLPTHHKPWETKPMRRGQRLKHFTPSDGYSRSCSSTHARPFQRADGRSSNSINSSCHCCSSGFGPTRGLGHRKDRPGPLAKRHRELHSLAKSHLIGEYEPRAPQTMSL